MLHTRALVAAAVIAATGTAAFAGNTILFEDNSGLDRTNVGNWTWVVGGTPQAPRDNIAANGDIWLATNTGHFVKENGASVVTTDSGTTAAPGYVGAFTGAAGDTLEAFYTVSSPVDIPTWRPVKWSATIMATVNRFEDVLNTNKRAKNFDTSLIIGGVTPAGTTQRTLIANYAYTQAPTNGPADIDMPDLDAQGYAQNYGTAALTSGYFSGVTATAGVDNLQFKLRGVQNSPNSNGKHIGAALGNLRVELAFQGDADLNDSVDVGDLGVLASNWSTVGGATWATGDWNGDGNVDVGDLGLLASNWNASGSTSLSFSEALALFPNVAAAVPEPASLGLLAIGALGLLRRRK